MIEHEEGWGMEREVPVRELEGRRCAKENTVTVTVAESHSI